MWETAWRALVEALGEDFAEFRDVGGLIRVATRLALAAVLGGMLGIERTVRNRPAGLRTYMLVSLGSASFVLVALGAGIAPPDLSRVIQGLMTGVGFLGAGVIVKSDVRHEPRGLTTAAGVWLTSAVGMAAGLGRPATALLTAGLGLIVLAPLRRIEERVDRRFHDINRGEDDPGSRRSP
jgi:putative Mg2+ transporter-C (MgtC) family protein